MVTYVNLTIQKHHFHLPILSRCRGEFETTSLGEKREEEGR